MANFSKCFDVSNDWCESNSASISHIQQYNGDENYTEFSTHKLVILAWLPFVLLLLLVLLFLRCCHCCVSSVHSISLYCDLYLRWSFLCVLLLINSWTISPPFQKFSTYTKWKALTIVCSCEKCIDLKLFSFQSVSITTSKASLNAFTWKYLFFCCVCSREMHGAVFGCWWNVARV